MRAKPILILVGLIILAGIGYQLNEQYYIFQQNKLAEEVVQDFNERTERLEPESEPPSVKAEQALPKKVVHDVPFTSQAPFADWEDQRQQDACEEASLLMAYAWVNNLKLTKQSALDEILAMTKYELDNYGYHNDTSAADTAKLMREYFEYDNIELVYDIKVDDIRTAIAQGNVVVVPAQGQWLGNPNFSGEGPERHKLVITGYDDRRGEFITNDPGTRNGEGYRYDYEILIKAVLDYPSGYKVPISEHRKAMIVVKPLSS